MELSRRKVCSVLLSVGIIASSIGASAYAEEKKDYISKGASIETPSFVIGELSEKSGESPEKIVEKNYGKELKGSGSLEQKSFKQIRKFKNSMGRTVISTTQTFNGVRVYGTDQNFHINDDGVIECVAGSRVEDIESKVISKNFSAKYSQKDVLNAVEKYLGFKPDYKTPPQPEIILYPVSGKYNYVYEVNVEAFSPCYISCTYYIDAGSLSVINVNNHIRSVQGDIPVVGSGIGQFNYSRELQIVQNNGLYYLRNANENLVTSTATVDRYNSNPVFGAVFSEPDSNFNSDNSTNYQNDAVDAHANVTKVSSFFRNAPFYRNGNDGNGNEVKVAIITNSSAYTPSAYSDINYIGFNTFQGPNGKSTSCCVDITAHEFTHGILRSEGMLGYQNETLALSEGVADVFGVLGEYFITNDGSTDDWLMGEDIYNGGCIRDCANPEITNYSDYLALQYPTSIQGAGIITKAASLMAMGGTHNGVTVSAIGYGKLARIFYNAINDGYITNDTSLKQFANYAVQVANLLYGGNSQAYRNVKDAFTAVGLLSAPPPSFRLIYVSGMNVQLAWDTTSGSRVGVYRKGAGTNGEPVLIDNTTSTTGLLVSTLSGSCDFYAAYVDASGNRLSTYSNAINIDKMTKSAPTNFGMTYRSGLSVQFGWSGTTGEKCAIYRKISDTNDEFVKVGETTSNQMSVDSLIGKCDFVAAIVSSDGIRLSPFSNVYSVETYLSAPANFNVTDGTTSTVTFFWNAAAAANRYAVYRTPYGTNEAPVKVAETKNTSMVVYTTTGRYNYQAAIVDLEGNRISSFSSIVTVQK